MIELKKLYLESQSGKATFQDIEFHSGLNIILGEESRDNYDKNQQFKTNGVGKSLIVEVIDYCLLADLKTSRLNKLPIDLLDDRDLFCLDLVSIRSDKTTNITIKRNRLHSGSQVFITTDGDEVEYSDLTDARLYLEQFFVLKLTPDAPSLRSILSIIIRKEDTLYGDIFYTDSESKRYNYSDLIKPHMYLFDVNLELIKQVKITKNELKETKKLITAVRKDFKLMNVTEKDVKSHINDLQDKISNFNTAITTLEPSDAIEQKKIELASLQDELRQLTTDKTSKEMFLKKINSLPKAKKVDTEQVRFVYNSYKQGLGDLVAGSFDEVVQFRREIEQYQEQLSVDKQKEIGGEIQQLNAKIRDLRLRVSDIYKIFNVTEKVDDLTKAIEIQQSSKRDLDLLSTKYGFFNEKKALKQELERKLIDVFDALDANIFELQKTVNSFEDDLKQLHEAVAGNKKCQFEIIVNKDNDKYIQANYRIDLDGSAGINRLATFMYDFLLMTNRRTSVRHPGFLIHDNIFPLTSRDDMVKSLNYVYESESLSAFQYIVTLNKDEFESRINDLAFGYKDKTIKVLTRQNKLLGKDYSEIR